MPFVPDIIHMLLLILICAIGILCVFVKMEERKHIREEYWVEYLSPGRLRGDEDTFAVVYHEGEQQQFFNGKIGNRSRLDQLVFPDEESWLKGAPEWLQGKRQIVLKRILANTGNLSIASPKLSENPKVQ